MPEYQERHKAVWPEMQKALHDTGWRNYSLFLRDDGLLIGYLESDDFEAARAAMGRTEVNKRWQASMMDFFESDQARPADQQMRRIPEVFHLD